MRFLLTKRMKGAAAGLLLAALWIAPAASAAARQAASAPQGEGTSRARTLDEILRRFDEVQAQVRTMTANFTETKELRLLRDPVVSKGKFYYTRPNDVLWEYTDPTPKAFLISRDELLAYYPEEKRAEKLDISRYQSRLLKVFGIGQVSEDLKKYYELSLSEPGPRQGIYELILSPRRRMVRKRIEEVRFWIDSKSFLPLRMQYFEKDGDKTTLAFDDTQVNGVIDEATYRIDLPPDVKIQNTFTGLGSSKGAS